MKKLICLFTFTFLALSIFSQTVLWEITGRRLSEPSYLYGTIHISDKRVFAFPDEVLEAFNSTDAYAMELLLDEIDPEVMNKAMLMDGDKTIEDLLSPEEFKLLDSIVKERTGQGMFFFNRMKPFFLSTQLMQLDMAKDKEHALDAYLMEMAREQGKELIGIEELSDQLNAIDAISLEDQAKMLMQGIMDTLDTEDSGSQMEELIQSYLEFDLEKMYQLSKDTAMPPEFYQAFLIDRNIKMARNIHRIIRRQSAFNAVGAAHLPGEQGVIQLLRDRGYTVEPIIFEWRTEE